MNNNLKLASDSEDSTNNSDSGFRYIVNDPIDNVIVFDDIYKKEKNTEKLDKIERDIIFGN